MSQKYTLWDGITRAIGSVIGSGILFLPSYTFAIAGGDVLIVWVLTILLCIPGLIFLSDMVEAVPNNSGMGGFISLGLGKHFGNALPMLMLSTVCLGMPSAALISGKYISNFFNSISIGFSFVQYITALIIIWFAVFSNLKNLKTNSKISTILTVLLLVIAAALFFMTFDTANGDYHKIKPVYNISAISSGVILAFWAFAGFENLTFMASKFKNPKRDLFLSCSLAILICGALYLALTANYAAIVDSNHFDKLAGLYYLSEYVTPKTLSTLVISLFALFAVQINFNSWIEGISGMVQASSNEGYLPKLFSKVDSNNNPHNAIFGIGIVFTIVATFGFFFPSIFEKFLKTVATNFVYMYLLAILAYFVRSKLGLKKILSLMFCAGLVYVLLSDINYIYYPIVVSVLAIILSMKKERQYA